MPPAQEVKVKAVSGIRKSTLAAWAPVIWVFVTCAGLSYLSGIPDWLCGAPDGEPCRFYDHHPWVFAYMVVGVPPALFCLVWSLGLACQKKLSVLAVVGLVLSAAIALAILGVAVFLKSDTAI